LRSTECIRLVTEPVIEPIMIWREPVDNLNDPADGARQDVSFN
jgi:hypothetical protein